MRIKFLLILSVLLVLAIPAATWAQDAPGNYIINWDDVVQETITEGAFFDWWRIQAVPGDIIVVYMTAYDGLAPFLGILDQGQNVVATSEPGPVNGSVTAEWTVEVAGLYTIIATRVDDEDGTTTGSYELSVRNGRPADSFENPYQEVTFVCQDFEAANVATIQFADDPDQAQQYRISVYGFDGFQPVIRVNLSVQGQTVNDCSRDDRFMGGDVVTLPSGDSMTVEEGEANSAARLVIGSAGEMGNITLTIGSAHSTPGRYFALIEGFTIGGVQDTDGVLVQNGPLAASAPITVYMVRAQNSRLDPFLTVLQGELNFPACDDAGRRTCDSEILSFRNAGVAFGDGTPALIGSRFDAGFALTATTTDTVTIELTSFNNNTTGTYALVFIGELPAPE